MTVEMHLGDCLSVMRTLEADSVDSIVTDPPYGLSDGPAKYLGDGGRGGFMGKEWDHGVPGVPFWEAALRVAKPGAMLLAFGGTRTHHRLMVAIEDAGWEIRDCLMWLYGSGMPKGHNISKAIDRMAGKEREVIGTRSYAYPDTVRPSIRAVSHGGEGIFGLEFNGSVQNVTAPATDAAKQWDGWNTNLKPAWEPIILARKPLSEPTIAANVLRWGTGGINVDACRIDLCNGDRKSEGGRMEHRPNSHKYDGWGMTISGNNNDGQGRWPANLALDDEAAELLDEMSGVSMSNDPGTTHVKANGWGHSAERRNTGYAGDQGGASRFFLRVAPDDDPYEGRQPLRFMYEPKASKRDRDEGLEGMPTRKVETMNGYVNPSEGRTADKNGGPKANHHPTVKPTALMRWLVRLVTPPGGTVLDCFAGSGSTLKAAVLEGFNGVGIELDAEYLAIAQKRIEQAAQQPSLFEVTP